MLYWIPHLRAGADAGIVNRGGLSPPPVDIRYIRPRLQSSPRMNVPPSAVEENSARERSNAVVLRLALDWPKGFIQRARMSTNPSYPMRFFKKRLGGISPGADEEEENAKRSAAGEGTGQTVLIRASSYHKECGRTEFVTWADLRTPSIRSARRRFTRWRDSVTGGNLSPSTLTTTESLRDSRLMPFAPAPPSVPENLPVSLSSSSSRATPRLLRRSGGPLCPPPIP